MKQLVFTVLLFTALAFGQSTIEYAFVWQPSSIPGLEQYAVVVKNPGAISVAVTAADVMVEAQRHGVRMATYMSVLRAVEDANQRSPFRYIGIALEIGGYAVATLSAGSVIKIRENWKAAIPGVSAALTLTRTVLNRERRDIGLPSDLIPVAFNVLPGESVSYSIFGVAK